MSFPATTSQTVGPFFEIGFRWLNEDQLAGEGVSGERVTIRGRVLDGDGVPVPDAVIEIWQANAHGRYAHPEDRQDKPFEPGFSGYGRVPVNPDGVFSFSTIKPGPVPGPDGREQAPHLGITLFMRGLLRHLWTRMYFPGDARNATDPILNLVAPDRRCTLIAMEAAGDPGTLEWNVVLQGAGETVFFELGL